MSIIFPAAPGTTIISREQGAKVASLMPVIGWHHVQGGVAFPICAMTWGGLTRGKAVITPDGLVTDPSYGIVCKDRDEWMALTNGDAYWTAKDKRPPAPSLTDADHRQVGEEDRVNAQAEVAAMVRKRADEIMLTPKRIPDRPARTRKPRVFQTNSWWKNRNSAPQEITQINAGIAVPFEDDPTWEKIGVVDFKALKKEGYTVVQYGAASDADDLI